jgi:hypothetical protein
MLLKPSRLKPKAAPIIISERKFLLVYSKPPYVAIA